MCCFLNGILPCRLLLEKKKYTNVYCMSCVFKSHRKEAQLEHNKQDLDDLEGKKKNLKISPQRDLESKKISTEKSPHCLLKTKVS